MSDSISISEFEIWYHRWYWHTLRKLGPTSLETSVKDSLKGGDEIVVYGRPSFVSILAYAY
jgi:hypothetical protein